MTTLVIDIPDKLVLPWVSPEMGLGILVMYLAAGAAFGTLFLNSLFHRNTALMEKRFQKSLSEDLGIDDVFVGFLFLWPIFIPILFDISFNHTEVDDDE